MPGSWWGKALVWIYLGVFWVRIAYIAVVAWPQMGFAEWQWYIGWQFLWGMVWPITLLVAIVAGFIKGYFGL